MENKGTEKQIKLYDSMNQAYGVAPERAGDEMAEIGLIGKAIEYYNASGKGWSKECQELERLAFKNDEKIRENSRIIGSHVYNNPEINEGQTNNEKNYF